MDARGREGEPVCIDDEIPFVIPEGWAWCRLESLLSDVIVPIRDKPTKLDGPIPWCRIEDVEGRYLSRSLTGKGVDEDTIRQMNLKVYPIGTVLCSNSATIGVPAIIQTPCVTNQRFIGFKPAIGLDAPYLYLLFLAFNKILTTVGTGTTHAYIARAKFEQLLVPLPPAREQSRIASVFDEVDPLVDAYGALEDARERLDAELPSRLRKSVLQMAVQGKLVPQDPSDEPASALLGRIRAERAKLIKEKKLKAPRGGESVIFRASDGGHYEKRVDARGREGEPQRIEVPFEIPEGWAWARMSTLCDFGKCVNVEYDAVIPGTWNLDLEDLEKDSGRILQKKRKRAGEKGSTKHVFSAGMVLYSKLRPYLNKVAVADENGVCTSEILPLAFNGVTSEFAQIVLMAPLFVDYAKAHSYGVKMPRLGTTDGANFLVPIPPIPEQKRIVEVMTNYRKFTNQ
ncbi:MAG: restriction endonuclease subunit S [Coriobacteriales bacterium]|nr:restriction endonuclease subunit S [Coriobacteriales bacterium]